MDENQELKNLTSTDLISLESYVDKKSDNLEGILVSKKIPPEVLENIERTLTSYQEIRDILRSEIQHRLEKLFPNKNL